MMMTRKISPWVTLTSFFLSIAFVASSCGSNKVNQDDKKGPSQNTESKEEPKEGEPAEEPETKQTGGQESRDSAANSAQGTTPAASTPASPTGTAPSGALPGGSFAPPEVNDSNRGGAQTSVASGTGTSASETRFVDEKGKKLSDDDLTSIQRCLAQFRAHPFIGGQTHIVRKLDFTASVAGITLGGSDSPTATPRLVLIDSGFTTGLLGGTPTLNLLNPNGFYCMKPQLNISSDVVINLHCNAEFASSREQFAAIDNLTEGIPFANILLGSTSGVNVQSSISVNRLCR